MKESSVFQLILLVVFGFAVVIAVLIFAGIIPGFRSGGSADRPTLIIWGYFPAESMRQTIDAFNREYDNLATLRYIEKDPTTFEADIGNSLAGGAGPDIVFLPDSLIVRHGDKMVPFSSSEYSERKFRNDFIEQGEMFVDETGAIALPILADPMVLFYNRDLFSASGVARPPASWTELIQPEIGPTAKLTQFDNQGNLVQSAIPMGEYSNITHAKDIISLLMMQAGSNIVTRSDADSGESFLTDIGGFVTVGSTGSPSASALDFYMQFSNPTKNAYTWNRSMPMSLDAFAAGFSAMYLGFASELETIRLTSPVLNVDVALAPQRERSRQVTVGRVYGLAATRKNQSPVAKQVIRNLLVGQYPNMIAKDTGLVPASRVLLSAGTDDPYRVVFYQSALISRSWYDPEPRRTDQIFQDMVEGVGSGRITATDAVSRAQSELSNLISIDRSTDSLAP